MESIWKEITEREYERALDAAPPVRLRYDGFLQGEAVAHRECSVTRGARATYSTFVSVGEKFYARTASMTAPEFDRLTAAAVRAELAGAKTVA